MAIKARSAKAKGTRLEVQVVKDLQGAGLEARRQPGSGIYSAFPHDVECRIKNKRYIVECKQRKSSFKQLDGWMGAADFLVVRIDGGQSPRVYMDWQAFLSIIEETDE